MTKEVIYTQKAPAPIGSYSQAIKTKHFIFLSGQIALDPQSGNMINQSFLEEVAQVFKNLEEITTAAGKQLTDVVKYTIYLTDLALFAAVNDYMEKHLTAPYPARVTVGVASLPKGAKVEIDAILES